MKVLQAFFATSVVLLTVLALSVPFVEAGTASFAVALVSFAMLGFVAAVSAALVYVDWDPFAELL